MHLKGSEVATVVLDVEVDLAVTRADGVHDLEPQHREASVRRGYHQAPRTTPSPWCRQCFKPGQRQDVRRGLYLAVVLGLPHLSAKGGTDLHDLVTGLASERGHSQVSSDRCVIRHRYFQNDRDRTCILSSMLPLVASMPTM